jgi:hypothetical protein
MRGHGVEAPLLVDRLRRAGKDQDGVGTQVSLEEPHVRRGEGVEERPHSREQLARARLRGSCAELGRPPGERVKRRRAEFIGAATAIVRHVLAREWRLKAAGVMPVATESCAVRIGPALKASRIRTRVGSLSTIAIVAVSLTPT